MLLNPFIIFTCSFSQCASYLTVLGMFKPVDRSEFSTRVTAFVQVQKNSLTFVAQPLT